MIRLRARQSKYLRSIPIKQEGIFVLQSVQAETKAHQATYEKSKEASYHVGGSKAAGVWGWPLHPFNAVIENTWSYTSTSPKCLTGAHSNNFATTSLYSDVQNDIHSLLMEVKFFALFALPVLLCNSLAETTAKNS